MSPEATENLINQIHENWVKPEVERRSFPEPIYAILIIFKKGATEIRFNQETKLKIEIDPTVGGHLTPGAPVTATDLAKHRIKNISVPDEVFENHPYIAAVVIDKKWTIYFNFIPNKTEAKEKLALAEDFLIAARSAANDKVRSYNAFHALEQAVHAALLENPTTESKIKQNKTHNGVKVQVNLQSKQGNMPQRIADLFNNLHKERPKIYSREKTSVSLTDADITVIENFIQSLRRSVTQ